MILYLMAKTKFYQKKKTFQFEIRVLAKKIFIKKKNNNYLSFVES